METVESPEPRHPGLRDCAAALRRHRVLVLGGLAAGLLAAGIALAAVPAAYTAQASVQVEPAGDAATAGAPPGSASGGVDVATEAQIVRSTEVAAEAADLLGTAEAPAALRERVAVEAPPSSSVLDIAYTAGSPQAARRGAAAFADAYLADRADRARTRIDDRLDALRGQLDDREGELAGLTRSGAEAPGTASPTRGAGRAEALQNEITELTAAMTPLSAARDALDPGRVITPAVAPEAPESPRGLLWPAAGGLLGLAAGAAAALAADRRDRTLRTVRDLRRATPLPVLL
ncbi:Wzz/FepE/Etk N-terminal domain-containing protein, partial [Nocardiopsis coralliicola]